MLRKELARDAAEKGRRLPSTGIYTPKFDPRTYDFCGSGQATFSLAAAAWWSMLLFPGASSANFFGGKHTVGESPSF